MAFLGRLKEREGEGRKFAEEAGDELSGRLDDDELDVLLEVLVDLATARAAREFFSGRAKGCPAVKERPSDLIIDGLDPS